MTHNHVHNDISQAKRRASTSVAGSLGRAGLFLPQDFINFNKKKIGSALSNMEHDLEDEESEPDIEANSLDDDDTDVNICPLTKSRRNSFLISEEANLLKANGIQIKHIHSTPDSGRSQETLLRDSTLQMDNYDSICQDEEEEEDDIIESWDEAVKAGKIKTTTSFEIKSISKSAVPLVLTFLMQNSLSVCSIFVVGHISSEALAGITLGAMTSNITAIATIAGLASSLDTFLPQAYGAKKYHLVGIIYQRCCVLIFTIMFFVCISWWIWAEKLLTNFLPDKQAAIYAAQYLKVTSFGIPGYILFETGKRFLQCQGIFDASTYVLFVCAPLNAFLNYFFVWILKLGYIGAPIAVSINYTLMAIGLFAYTRYTKNKINPMKCWTKFELKRVYRNWNELIKLSIPNLIMIMSEFLSFEILTLLSSYLGTVPLAAQSILATMASLTYQIPYAVSIACSTRIANFLGAQLPQSAFTTCKSTFLFTAAIALFNSLFLFVGKDLIASWFTNDLAVIEQVRAAMPVVAFMQIFDALNTTSAGILRGQGLQRIGGYVNLFSYYLVGLPLGAYLAFCWPNKEHSLGLSGLWFGSVLALIIIGSVQSYFSLNADFDQLVKDAMRRSNSD
ncbi:hypothetical protein CANINC_003068 [Pichia inconspicua]|uniref:Uncharacterized protein n=1 Tax=Pichia inconspicua TaxID=52247 RepID=A0A4T0X197_9ASCO|nr:hypothetical protein CANINC_003068 [[Candida] inconspicua]